MVSGLPLAENTLCELFVTDSHLIVEAQGQTFQIAANKMIAAQTKTDVEIQREMTSSAGKSVAGAVLFGAAGAIIGGRAKTKTTRVISCYLIINDINQNEEAAVLAFDGQGSARISRELSGKIQPLRAGSVTNL